LKINNDAPASVIFARDTRTSGPTLVAALVDALQATDVQFTDYKILTTPQLHYLVRCTNTEGTQYAYGETSEKGYYEKLSTAFKQAMKHRKTDGPVTVDCANGVGGPKLRELIKFLPSAKDGGIDIKVINDDVLNPDALNVQVIGPLLSPVANLAPEGGLIHLSAVRTLSKLVKQLHQPANWDPSNAMPH
jgi:phosphoacetylglucosamine mutase